MTSEPLCVDSVDNLALVQAMLVEMATEIERTISENLRNADREVSNAMLAYRRAHARRAQVYRAATEVLSQKQVADLTGISQQRVSQIVKEPRPLKAPKKAKTKVRVKRDA